MVDRQDCLQETVVAPVLALNAEDQLHRVRIREADLRERRLEHPVHDGVRLDLAEEHDLQVLDPLVLRQLLHRLLDVLLGNGPVPHGVGQRLGISTTSSFLSIMPTPAGKKTFQKASASLMDPDGLVPAAASRTPVRAGSLAARASISTLIFSRPARAEHIWQGSKRSELSHIKCCENLVHLTAAMETPTTAMDAGSTSQRR
mmetsp:Transcript_69906/g.218192  ORF Transcript_69906/g.218192 Transcript_69906/m.218192 type:complete len:202 (-) Transcript_69906:68-673(-)